MRMRGLAWVGLGGAAAGLFFGVAACGPLAPSGTGGSITTGGGGTSGTAGEGGTTSSAGSGGSGVCEPPPPMAIPGPTDHFEDDDSRWIVRDPDGLCPDLASGDWNGQRIWTGTIQMELVAGAMKQYCLYTWKGMGPPDPTLLPPSRARDRRTITPQAPTVQGWAHDDFLADLDLPPAASTAPHPRVRVIVADTTGEGGAGGAVGSNTHGRLIERLVQDTLRCPPQSCAVNVEARLALPRARHVDSGKEYEVSDQGDFGRLTDLAGAVDRALVKWESELSTLPDVSPEMLVLNLSLGYAPQSAPTAGEGFSGDELIVDALKSFACHGGIAFAAAGNHGGAGSSGLLAPASLQDTLEPTDVECEALLGSAFHTELRNTYTARKGTKLRRPYKSGPAPFLHGVGAVDRSGLPIKKTRPNACPHYGARGLGWGAPGTTEVLTGTSLSAAVAAGIFAATASQSAAGALVNPYMTEHPQTVLDLVADSAPVITFVGPGPCGEMWSCDKVPWIAGKMPPSAGPNDVTSFPWADFSPNNASFTLGPATDNGCSQSTLCEAPALSPVSEISPQPNGLVCLKGCYLDIMNNVIYIDPATDLQVVKLTVDDGSSLKIYDLTDPNGAGSFAVGTRYKLALPGQAQGTLTANLRVIVSAFDASGRWTLSEQALLVQ